jgi:hypothetical protein
LLFAHYLTCYLKKDFHAVSRSTYQIKKQYLIFMSTITAVLGCGSPAVRLQQHPHNPQ